MNNLSITSVSVLIRWLKRHLNKGQPMSWYRGHSLVNWKLEPSYNRQKNLPEEKILVNEFRQKASYLLEKHVPTDDFDWFFLMQHYGVPTRLLDWTESPLVALYFAVEDKKRVSKDGALWLLMPNKLNENSYKDDNGYIPAFEEDDYMNGYRTKTDRMTAQMDDMKPIAAIAKRNNPRIQAQLGVFTISHRGSPPIEKVGDMKHVKKFIVPAKNKEQILGELELLGLGKLQVFPELSTVGEIVGGKYK